jgi:carbamate kinase
VVQNAKVTRWRPVYAATMPGSRTRRILIALGGNAIATQTGHDPRSQQAAVDVAMEQVARVVEGGHEVVLTHGNGPQVGDLLVANELARESVAPLPLDWCVAETQATLGYIITNSLERALERRGIARLVIPVLTRVRVDRDDPAWETPTKPVGRYASAEEAAERIGAGESWSDQGPRGWRRLVPSPEPREILDREVIERHLKLSAVVIAGGGGGIPMVHEDGGLRGVEAVLDKDLTGALLARVVGAECFVMATDVRAVALRYGTDSQEWIERTTPAELAAMIDQGHFASGSMGPKVEAALRFVRDGGSVAVIASLADLADAVDGRAGTVIEAERVPAA